MTDPNILYKISEYRLLTEYSLLSEDSDYFFIQYLAYILTYIERDCITDFGFKTVEFNIKPIIDKFKGECTKEKVTQNDLINFCLYTSNSNKICKIFLSKISLYKLDKDVFRNNSKLPDCVLDDFIRFEDRIYNLSIIFNKVLESYSPFLGTKHKIMYNKDKHRSFLTAKV